MMNRSRPRRQRLLDYAKQPGVTGNGFNVIYLHLRERDAGARGAFHSTVSRQTRRRRRGLGPPPSAPGRQLHAHSLPRSRVERSEQTGAHEVVRRDPRHTP